jgi:hypothetical protein
MMDEVPKHLQSQSYYNPSPKKKKPKSPGKEKNAMGGLNMAKLKRDFQAKQESKEKKSKDSEKNLARREITRLKREKKSPLAHKENIEHVISLKKKRANLK